MASGSAVATPRDSSTNRSSKSARRASQAFRTCAMKRSARHLATPSLSHLFLPPPSRLVRNLRRPHWRRTATGTLLLAFGIRHRNNRPRRERMRPHVSVPSPPHRSRPLLDFADRSQTLRYIRPLALGHAHRDWCRISYHEEWVSHISLKWRSTPLDERVHPASPK
jgi:hypothetical protein